MEKLQQKTLKTRRSLNYTYFASASGKSTEQQPALLFIHGFPDSAFLWEDVVAKLIDLPNKIIIPHCLGYAGTDKPDDTRLYAYKGQAEDLADILDSEEAEFTIIIGHDWGSAVAQRTYLYNRQRFRGVILLNAGYMVPSDQLFDLATVNKLTEEAWGYPQFSYWEFFTAPDAAKVINANLDRMWQVLHGDVEDWMKKMFCVPGAMRKFLLSNEEVPLKDHAKKQETKDRFMQQFGSDGFVSSLQMYWVTAFNVQTESEAALSQQNLTFEVPTLFVICSRDAVCSPEMMSPAKARGLLPDLKEVVIDSAHWSPMEKPDEIATSIREFINDKFPSK
jgi:soluble epoxide hydrolase/lipid-phosphate phosphatase